MRYAQRGFVPEEFGDAPILAKPFEAEHVRAAIAAMINSLRFCGLSMSG